MLRLVSTAWTLLVLLNYVVHGRALIDDPDYYSDYPTTNDVSTDDDTDFFRIYSVPTDFETDSISTTEIPTDNEIDAVTTNAAPTPDTEADSVSTSAAPTSDIETDSEATNAAPTPDTNVVPVNTQDLPKGSDHKFVLTDGKYYIYRVEVNWFQAMEMCVLLGKRSATFNTEAEYKRLTDVMRRNEKFHKEGRYWIGGSELGRSGRYVWMPTGRPLKHSPWNDGEPNNTGPDRNKVEHCIELKGDNYGMNNRRCEMPGYVVCESVV